MVECGGLENRCGVTPTVGSNPTPSASGAGQRAFPLACTQAAVEFEAPALTAALTKAALQTGSRSGAGRASERANAAARVASRLVGSARVASRLDDAESLPRRQYMNIQPLTVASLAALPPVIPVAVADEILGIGQTLSKRLRAKGTYPVRILPGLGRHHRVSTMDLLAYLGLSSAAEAVVGADAGLPDGSVHALPVRALP